MPLQQEKSQRTGTAVEKQQSYRFSKDALKYRFKGVLKREDAVAMLKESVVFVIYYEWPSDDVMRHSSLRLMIAYRTSFDENRIYRIESFGAKNDHYYQILSASHKVIISREFSSIQKLVEYCETFQCLWSHPETGEVLLDVFPWWKDAGNNKTAEATEIRRALRRQKRRANCPLHTHRPH